MGFVSPSANAQDGESNKVQQLFQKLENNVKRYRLSGHSGKRTNNAIANYHALVKAEASTSTLDKAAALIRDGYERWVKIRLDQGNTWAALVRIDNALKAWPDHPKLRKLRNRISKRHELTRGETRATYQKQLHSQDGELNEAFKQRIKPLILELAQNISAFRLSSRSGRNNALNSLAKLRKAGAPTALMNKAEDSLAEAYQNWILEPETANKREAALVRLSYALKVLPRNLRLQKLAEKLREPLIETAQLSSHATESAPETEASTDPDSQFPATEPLNTSSVGTSHNTADIVAAVSSALPKPQPKRGTSWVDPVSQIPFAFVPRAQFTMGSSEIGTEDDAKPEIRVHVDGFWIARHETTVNEFQGFVDATGTMPGQWQQQLAAQAKASVEGQQLPVSYVTWEQAMAFSTWLSQQPRAEGSQFRLPTEAEWELACNGGGQAQRVSSVQAKKLAWFVENSDRKVHPIEQLEANSLGLYDTSGNLAEWTIESYSADTYQQRKPDEPLDNPRLVRVKDDRFKSVRGGSWGDYSRYVRCSSRGVQHPRQQLNTLGFRLLREF